MSPSLRKLFGNQVPANAWREPLLLLLQRATATSGIPQWMIDTLLGKTGHGIHLGVFVEPYLGFILEGKKTIESRFSMHKHAPFQQVNPGDLIILKRSSGPVRGICRVSHAWYYRVDATTWDEIESYAAALCMDASPFWQSKKAASYATLMRIEDVCRLPDLEIDKVDPQSWVVLKPSQKQPRLTGL
jgi:hypothetical protein